MVNNNEGEVAGVDCTDPIQAKPSSKPNLKQLSQPLTKAEPVLADNVLTA